jgi:hypothetical protein
MNVTATDTACFDTNKDFIFRWHRRWHIDDLQPPVIGEQ